MHVFETTLLLWFMLKLFGRNTVVYTKLCTCFQLSSNGNDSTATGGFPIIRWAQTGDYGYAPNHRLQKVFMAVAMDLGNASAPFGSIHPNDKQDVGYRLALAGRAIAYAENVYYSGPLVSDVVFTELSDAKWKATIKYKDVGVGGIKIRSTDGFEVSLIVATYPDTFRFRLIGERRGLGRDGSGGQNHLEYPPSSTQPPILGRQRYHVPLSP